MDLDDWLEGWMALDPIDRRYVAEEIGSEVGVPQTASIIKALDDLFQGRNP